MSNEACNSFTPIFDMHKAPEMKLIGYLDVIDYSENPPESLSNTYE